MNLLHSAPALPLATLRTSSSRRLKPLRLSGSPAQDIASCRLCRAKLACRAGPMESVAVAPSTGPSDQETSTSFEQTYQEGADFLRSLGLENRAEVARILDIAMNPGSLFISFRDRKRSSNPAARKLSVEDDMRPVLDCLLEQGFSRKEAAQVISEHPPVLCYSPSARLRPFFSYLVGLGFKTPDRLVLARPSLLGLEVEGGLKRMVEYLQAQDYSLDEIARLLETTL